MQGARHQVVQQPRRTMKQLNSRSGKFSAPARECCNNEDWMLQRVSFVSSTRNHFYQQATAAATICCIKEQLLLGVSCCVQAQDSLWVVFGISIKASLGCNVIKRHASCRLMPSKVSWHSSGGAHSRPTARLLGCWLGSSWLQKGELILPMIQQVSYAGHESVLQAQTSCTALLQSTTCHCCTALTHFRP